MDAIGKANAEHYIWGQGCDGWYLVKSDRLTVIEERMPPATSETLHRHAQSRQFFFILRGVATMFHDGQISKLTAGLGIEIAPGVPHRIVNDSHAAVEFLVTSSPPSHGDREELGH